LSKRNRIVRNIPLVLVTIVAGLAVKSAVNYKTELDVVLEDTGDAIKIPPEIMIQVEDGKALIYWIDDKGETHFLTTTNSIVKNL
jgi:hypothetical protein